MVDTKEFFRRWFQSHAAIDIERLITPSVIKRVRREMRPEDHHPAYVKAMQYLKGTK